MTEEHIQRLLVFNPDLTIGQYLKSLPKPPVEYEVLTFQSAINDMIGCEDKKVVEKYLPLFPSKSKHIQKCKIRY